MLLAILVLLCVCVITARGNTCSWCENGNCTSAAYDCELAELDIFPVSISVRVEGRGFPYWRSSTGPALGSYSTSVNRAVIVSHGDGRDGNDYFCYLQNALALVNPPITEGTIIIGLQIFEAEDEVLDESIHIWWDSDGAEGFNSGGDGDGAYNWRWGGNSTRKLAESISIFQVIDEMLTTLTDTSLYPNLKDVVVTGHSSGGQLVQVMWSTNLS